MEDVETFRKELIGRTRDRGGVLTDVSEMRDRLATAKSPSHGLDVRTGPGRLQDLELFAQAGALLEQSASRRLVDHLPVAARAFGLSEQEARLLENAARIYWRVQAGIRLVFGEDVSGEIGTSASAFLSKLTGSEGVSALEEQLSTTAREVDFLITRCLAEKAGKP